jgi:hypothetical protein
LFLEFTVCYSVIVWQDHHDDAEAKDVFYASESVAHKVREEHIFCAL